MAEIDIEASSLMLQLQLTNITERTLVKKYRDGNPIMMAVGLVQGLKS
jgi:hypothetical protein